MVCSILGDIDVVCNSIDIKDCHQIKGERTIIKFSSRRKSSGVLNKIGKHGFNDEQGSTSLKASAPTTADYGLNVKVFSKTRL